MQAIRKGVALAALVMGGVALAAPPAATYVMQAGAGDTYEQESSKLVLGSTQSPEIRRFAQMMVADHTKSTADVKAAATKDGVRPAPPRLDAQGQADVAALRRATGKARDDLYVTQQKAAHQKALALHEDYASTGDRPALKAVAGGIAPVVKTHLDMLNDMGGGAARTM